MSEQTNTQELRVAKNHVTIEGRLLAKEVETGETKDKREFIKLKLDIETGENQQVRPEYFSMKTYRDKKTGEIKENQFYKSLVTVAEEYKAVADVGRDEADLVRIPKNNNDDYPNATIGLNEFYTEQGLRSFDQINGNRIERLKDKSEFAPHASFEIEMVVDSAMEEIDKEENTTGRAVLKGYTVVSNLGKPEIIPIECKVHPDGAGYVLDNYEKGDTVFVYGDIVNEKQVETVTIEAAFGKDKVEEKVTYVREYVITGGTDPYDEEDPKTYNIETIKEALTQREIKLEELENNFVNRKKNSNKKSGFDVNSSNKTKRDISDDDLPF